MDTTVKSVCCLLQGLHVIARVRNSGNFTFRKHLVKVIDHCAYLDDISQNVLMAVCKLD